MPPPQKKRTREHISIFFTPDALTGAVLWRRTESSPPPPHAPLSLPLSQNFVVSPLSVTLSLVRPSNFVPQSGIPATHPVPCFMANSWPPREGQSGRSVNLTTHLYPVQRLNMNGALPVLHIHGCMEWREKKYLIDEPQLLLNMPHCIHRAQLF